MQKKMLKELGDVFSSTRSRAEMLILLEGLLSPREIEEITLRWRLMTQLLQGHPQRKICQDLGVSLGKISRGSRLLQYGPPQFRKLIQRAVEQQKGSDA